MIIKRVTQQRSVIDVFFMSVWLIILLGFAGGFMLSYVAYSTETVLSGSLFGYTVILSLVAAVMLGTYNFFIGRTVKRRSERLVLLDAQHSVSTGFEQGAFLFTLSILDDKENVRNKRFTNIVRHKEWAYADFSYDVYKRVRGGEYRALTTYYSVMATKLPRQMPHVFFDSKKARRRQFRTTFSSAQIQSLEGNFDQHFATYFPAEYHIDGRSLISPEVMLAVLEADDYDVEIVGDHIFLFGDLRNPDMQVADMQAKILKIRDKLLHNTGTYRDENIPYAVGRERVSSLGAQLAINLTWEYVRLVMGVVVTILAIVAALRFPHSGVIWAIVFGAGIASNAGLKIQRERRRRKQVMTAYNMNKSISSGA